MVKKTIKKNIYEPTDKEEFMNPKQIKYFKNLLVNWKNELLRESSQTLNNLQSDNENQNRFDLSESWEFILEEKKCSADNIHTFGNDSLMHQNQVSHVRLNIYPDGGISRLRVYGTVAD